MRGVKDHLIGRVVGFPVAHYLDPSQVEDGDRLDTTRTEWGRISSAVWGNPGLCLGRNIHTGKTFVVQRDAIHTVMPEGYGRG